MSQRLIRKVQAVRGYVESTAIEGYTIPVELLLAKPALVSLSFYMRRLFIICQHVINATSNPSDHYGHGLTMAALLCFIL